MHRSCWICCVLLGCGSSPAAPDAASPDAESADAGSSDAGPSGITVTGTVATPDGTPVAGVPVIIGSAGPVQTDSAGHFTVPDVVAPYTAIAIFSATKTVIVVEGLTRADPTLFTIGSALVQSTGSIHGTLSGGTGFPEPTNTQTVIQLASAASLSPFAFSSTGASTFSISPVSWDSGSSVSGPLYALQYHFNGAGNFEPLSYSGFAMHAPVTVSGGSSIDAGDIALSTGAQTSATTFMASITRPAGYTLTDKSPALLIGGQVALSLPSDGDNTDTISYPLPNVTGATVQLTVHASGSDGSTSVAIANGLALVASGTTLGLLPAPVPGLPVDSASGVTNDTMFSWTPVSGGVHVLLFASSAPSLPQYFVVTAASDARIPDVSAAAGLVLPPAATYAWAVIGVAPYADTDAFAQGPAFAPVTMPNVYRVQSPIRMFTTAP